MRILPKFKDLIAIYLIYLGNDNLSQNNSGDENRVKKQTQNNNFAIA